MKGMYYERPVPKTRAERENLARTYCNRLAERREQRLNRLAKALVAASAAVFLLSLGAMLGALL